MLFRTAFLALLILCQFGCSEKSVQPLALAEAPKVLAEAFKSAPAAVRQQVDAIIKSLEAHQLPAASLQINETLALTELTDRQRTLLSQAQLGVGDQLRQMAESTPAPEAAAPGGAPVQPKNPPGEEAAAAAAVLHHYQQTK